MYSLYKYFVCLTIFIFITGIRTQQYYKFRYDQKSLADQCPSPDQIKHGYFHISGERRDILTYYCKHAYHVYGQATAVCRKGRWDNEPPICVSKGCSRLTGIQNGYTKIGLDGAVAEFECEKGKQMQGSTVIVCDGSKWNGTMPNCTDNRYLYEKKHSPKRPTFEYKTYLHEEELAKSDYSCISRRGNNRPPRLPFAFPSVRWAMVDKKPRLYVRYRCFIGYEMTYGEEYMYCRNGLWVGEKPKCARPGKRNNSYYPNDDPRSILEISLRNADYSCFDAYSNLIKPYVVGGKLVPKYSVVDGLPRLYLEVKCNNQMRPIGGDNVVYCKQKRWIGQLPTCGADQRQRDSANCRYDNGGCQQLCSMRNNRVRCECLDGYTALSDGKGCKDINECRLNKDECDHLCTNTPGSYTCSCRPGYRMLSDGKTCI